MREILGAFFAAVLAISSIQLFSNYQKQSLSNQQIAVAAGQAVKFNTAVQTYITQYSSTLTAVATASSPAVITVPMLQATSVSLLDSAFSSTNAFGQTWQAQVLQPTPGNLQALALGIGGTALTDKVGSSVAALIGSAGGFIPLNDSGTWPSGSGTAQGSFAGWSVSTAGYTGVSGGNIASLLTFSNGQFVSNYLYRNNVGNTSLNTMNTPIIMASTQTLGSSCLNVGAIAQDGVGNTVVCREGLWELVSGNYAGSNQYNSNTTLTAANDVGKLIVAGSAGSTFTLPPLSSVATGSRIAFVSQGGTSTLVPSGSDGLFMGTSMQSSVPLTGINTLSVTKASGVWFVDTNSGQSTVKGLGFGGTTWHGVSRSLNASYINNYSYPIDILAYIRVDSGGCGYTTTGYLNGAAVTQYGFGGETGAHQPTLEFIVPPGYSYQINGGCLYSWYELY